MRAAIRAARRATHPDRAQPEWRRRATEASAIVAQAGEVLGDTHRRRLYDRAGGNLAEYEAAELEGQRAEQQREQQRADEPAAAAEAAERRRRSAAEFAERMDASRAARRPA